MQAACLNNTLFRFTYASS